MTIKVLTIFPEMLRPMLEVSVIKRAIERGLLCVELIDIRPYSALKHKNTDDYPFGGGPGMLMLAQPIVDAVESNAGAGFRGPRLYLSPRGRLFDQQMARALAREQDLMLICGHYEGVDQRAIDLAVDEEVSIGDFVLTGGELGAMVIIDAVTRLLPGALGSDESSEDESFSDGLLEYPQYTRPREYRSLAVPEVLLSGDHKKIARWRRDQSLALTFARRPELLARATLDKKDRLLLASLRQAKNEKENAMKIGFIDYYLDEWHANNYPKWIAEQAQKLGQEARVAYAWAEIDREGGLTSEAWCRQHGVELLGSAREVAERSDALIVLSPDNSEHHERLGREALMSGKPVYMDKTFSPDLASGARMFDLAQAHGTQLCSTSALRCAPELNSARGDDAVRFMAVSGPGGYETYAVHQLEMVVTVMGARPRRVLAVTGGEDARQLLIDYDGRMASMTQMPQMDFVCQLARGGGRGETIRPSGFFEQLIAQILTFFRTGEPFVTREQTLAVMALLEAGGQALARPGEWIMVNTLCKS